MTDTFVLYVEDDNCDVGLFQNAFRREGIANLLQVVNDGEKAVDYLAGVGPYADRKAFPMPRLIVLDIKMPKMSGLDVVEWIRRQPALSSLIVIVFSSSCDSGDVARAYQLGANSFVIKPTDFEKLTQFVRYLKDYWLESNKFVALDGPAMREEQGPARI